MSIFAIFPMSLQGSSPKKRVRCGNTSQTAWLCGFSDLKILFIPCTVAAEQKARAVYDNILKLSDDPDVNEVIKFLRQREIVHFQRFGEAKRAESKHKFLALSVVVLYYKYKQDLSNCRIF